MSLYAFHHENFKVSSVQKCINQFATYTTNEKYPKLIWPKFEWGYFDAYIIAWKSKKIGLLVLLCTGAIVRESIAT